eukprot:11777360-Alexandrium_andersonii.AAC.1
MSASLVGSEMCIRDSPMRADTALGDGVGADIAVSLGALRRDRAPQRAHTVSYTHLTLPTICSV